MKPMIDLTAVARLTVAALVLTLAACNTDDLLEVNSPTQIPAENLESPTQAALLVNGALGDFECALGAHIAVGAILGDEFSNGHLTSAGWSLDRRDVVSGDSYGTSHCTGGNTIGNYVPISVSRYTSDNLLTKLQAWTDQQVAKRDSMIALMAVVSGFDYTMLGTDFCSAAVDVGPELQPAQLWATAEQRFNTAIEAATRSNASTLLTAARLGRARVRLYMGKKAEAAADAKLVPVNFVWNASASDVNSRRSNRPFQLNNQNRSFNIETVSRGLQTGGVEDPRTRVVPRAGANTGDGAPVWEQTKYASLSAPFPIATYDEAQLIIAEAEGGASAITIINALRTRAGVPALSAAEIANLDQTIIEERRKELWLEGFRMYDIIRFNLTQQPAVGTPHPRGQNYGNTKCLPLPDLERFNNPNIGR